MNIDIFENKKMVKIESFPKKIKSIIEEHFNDKEEGVNGTYKFSINRISVNGDVLVFPKTIFDFRGDGDTQLCEEMTHNLIKLYEVEAYAIGATIYKKKKDGETAHIVYLLENNEFVLIEIV